MKLADQLRETRTAERRFLSLWAMEQAVILPALDRVAAALDGSISRNSTGTAEDRQPILGE